MTATTRLGACALAIAAIGLGGTSLLAFAAFLLVGPMPVVALSGTVGGALTVDLALSVGFFLQHSLMVRPFCQDRLSRRIPRWSIPALYAAVSGALLWVVIAFWQPTGVFVYRLGQPGRALVLGVFLAILAGFAWVTWSLGGFDGFGLGPLRARLRGIRVRRPPLTIAGPYRRVRHPLYSLVLLLLWATPDLSLDRALLNTTWTVWIVVGALLEERDLVAAYGDTYRRYRRQVPMLIPWARSPRPDSAPSSAE